MTTLEISAYVCNFCEAVATFFKKTLKNWQHARQMEANRRVAQELIFLGFNQQKEYDHILQKMNDKAAEEYNNAMHK